MKQLLIIALFISLNNFTFSQSYEEICQMGIDSAKHDFSNGILRTVIYGISPSNTISRVLWDKYKIETIFAGDIVQVDLECYSNFMDEKIREKFGSDILDKAYTKAQYLDSIGAGDRDAYFPGGELALQKFIYCNLDLNAANYSDAAKGKVFLVVKLDTTGRPIEIEVKNQCKSDYSQEAIRLINSMPNWIPATREGRLFQQRIMLPIAFDSEVKMKRCYD